MARSTLALAGAHQPAPLEQSVHGRADALAAYCIFESYNSHTGTYEPHMQDIYKPKTPDALLCPKCGCALSVIAFITEAAIVRKILDHLGLPGGLPVLAPARLPQELTLDFEPDDSPCCAFGEADSPFTAPTEPCTSRARAWPLTPTTRPLSARISPSRSPWPVQSPPWPPCRPPKPILPPAVARPTSPAHPGRREPIPRCPPPEPAANYYPQPSPPGLEAKLGATSVILGGQLTSGRLRLVGQGVESVGSGVRIEYQTFFYGQWTQLEAFQPRDP